MQIPLLVSATAVTAAPTLPGDGFSLRGSTGTLHSIYHDDADEALVLVANTAGVAADMTVKIRLWGYSLVSLRWHPLGIGKASSPDVMRGVINGGNLIGVITTGQLTHAEICHGLTNFTRIAAEVVVITGASTAISMWLVQNLAT